MKWARKLPTVEGWYWFRDTVTEEQGVGYATPEGKPQALVLIDGDLSCVHWTSEEITNEQWEWYGPLVIPG